MEDREVGQIRNNHGRVGRQRGCTGKGHSGSGWRTERLDRGREEVGQVRDNQDRVVGKRLDRFRVGHSG